MDLLTELESLIPELEKGLDQASSLQEMEALRVEFLGRKGRIARIMSRLPELEPAQRPLLGQTANRVKESLTSSVRSQEDGSRQRRRGRQHWHALTRACPAVCRGAVRRIR